MAPLPATLSESEGHFGHKRFKFTYSEIITQCYMLRLAYRQTGNYTLPIYRCSLLEIDICIYEKLAI